MMNCRKTLKLINLIAWCISTMIFFIGSITLYNAEAELLFVGEKNYLVTSQMSLSSVWRDLNKGVSSNLVAENQVSDNVALQNNTGFQVEIMSVSTQKPYALTIAEIGAPTYIDRDYTITEIGPELEGGILIQTANDDKTVTEIEHLVLYFHKSAIVYVCYDKRGAATPPIWLEDGDWTFTSETISTTDSAASPMWVFSKWVDAGETITLGGNHAVGDTGARSNYFAVAQPSPVEIMSVSTQKPYALTIAEIGALTYIDRDYTITDITSGLSGGVLIQTANDDKYLAEEDHLTLRLLKDSTVYVCYDNRSKWPPNWLQDWYTTDETISTTDSSSSPMKVFRKDLAAGEEITLGGNYAGGDTGAHSNYIVVVSIQRDIYWNALAILLDGIDAREKYSIPVTEAVDFISAHSRFKVDFSSAVFDLPHTYTFYDCPEGPQQCVLVNKWDVDPIIWESVPTKDFYMLLWDTAGNPPLFAGGAWGVAAGVFKGGLNRPYVTIPVDPWWYNNEPYSGFSSRAAQIMTHEIVNAINAKLEVEPYECSPLVADPGTTSASEYEASRLSKLTDDCYLKYLANSP